LDFEGFQPRLDQSVPGVLARALVDEALEKLLQLLTDVVQGQTKGPRGALMRGHPVKTTV
jgi:hypothetical protein